MLKHLTGLLSAIALLHGVADDALSQHVIINDTGKWSGCVSYQVTPAFPGNFTGQVWTQSGVNDKTETNTVSAQSFAPLTEADGLNTVRCDISRYLSSTLTDSIDFYTLPEVASVETNNREIEDISVSAVVAQVENGTSVPQQWGVQITGGVKVTFSDSQSTQVGVEVSGVSTVGQTLSAKVGGTIDILSLEATGQQNFSFSASMKTSIVKTTGQKLTHEEFLDIVFPMSPTTLLPNHRLDVIQMRRVNFITGTLNVYPDDDSDGLADTGYGNTTPIVFKQRFQPFVTHRVEIHPIN